MTKISCFKAGNVFYYSEVDLWTLVKLTWGSFLCFGWILYWTCRATKNIILVSFYLTDVSVLCLRGSDFIKMKIKIIWRNDLQINPAYLWFIWLIPGQLRTTFFGFTFKSLLTSPKWPVVSLTISKLEFFRKWRLISLNVKNTIFGIFVRLFPKRTLTKFPGFVDRG